MPNVAPAEDSLEKDSCTMALCQCVASVMMAVGCSGSTIVGEEAELSVLEIPAATLVGIIDGCKQDSMSLSVEEKHSVLARSPSNEKRAWHHESR